MSSRTRTAVLDVLPELIPDAFEGLELATTGLDCPAVDEGTSGQIAELVGSSGFDAWSEALDRVGNCVRPIRLVGRSQTVDTSTGEITGTYFSKSEPLGVTYVRCGNRRASVCPPCARLYAADTFHLIRAGVAGGKTVPETVAQSPLVFATLTAPSFGRVHGRRDHGRVCHPSTRGPARCPHGRPRTCLQQHREDDPAVGQPVCPECYDYSSQVVWQWWSPALWRRFTIALKRLTAKQLGVPATRLCEVAAVQYAKVAEYQARGVVHFHALIRLDGPRTPEGFAPAPDHVDEVMLAQLVTSAAASVRLAVPGIDADDPDRVLAFGTQLDARPVHASRRVDEPGQALSPEQVAGYLAKYATKSVEDTGATQTAHHRRIRAVVQSLADRAQPHTTASYETPEDAPYALLGKWTHMLGFRGHFATKSRRYSITLGRLRRARRRAQALIAQHRIDGEPLDLASREAELLADDEDETTLVVGQWHYLGTGWENDAQVALANAAAARAREYDQWKAEQKECGRRSRRGTRS